MGSEYNPGDIDEFIDSNIPPIIENFDDWFKEFDVREVSLANANPPSSLSGDNTESIPGFSPEHHRNPDSQNDSTMISQAAAFSFEIQIQSNGFEIIAEPLCTYKLRTREDNKKEKRLTPLTTDNKNYAGPAVRIPSCYINSDEPYYIGIYLVTVPHEKTGCHHFHPYILEDYNNPDHNKDDGSIWYPITSDDSMGIKSFRNIRISKRKEEDLKQKLDLHVFYGCTTNIIGNVVPQSTSGRKLIQEYNLKTMHLSFIIGKKQNINDKIPRFVDPKLIIFSRKFEELANRDNESNEPTAISDVSIPDCSIYKYAPRYGYTTGDDEMLLFFSRKLEVKKYGELEVIFEYNAPNIKDITWSKLVTNKDIKIEDQLVSFRIPSFPYCINEHIPVNIKLQQKNRNLGTIQYYYIPKIQNSSDETQEWVISMTGTPNLPYRRKPIKRARLIFKPQGYHDETDAVVPVLRTKPESNSSNSTSQPLDDPTIKVFEKLEEYTITLFTSNSFTPFVRLCRSTIKKQPHLFHTAIENNYSYLLSQFIPDVPLELLQQKNQLGETILLHTLRLNRLDILKILLEHKKFVKLLDDVNNKKQNLFHILAMNKDAEQICDLLIEDLVKKSINIEEKFGNVDEDNHTPLELSIINDNLPITRYLLKYFNKNLCQTTDDTGDNLIHLAVRHSDLAMLKYLLNEGELKEHGNQTNLTMTPIELAQSLKHDDMVKYLNEIYPQAEFHEDESSDDD
ncbi:unnamed protein product [Adineta steineri]|uniref:Uncharacterized protein n=1 Tax=Adineta steineri TaxID=433720 RepID=A0A819XQR3_9BILA|nr:unnamed protein product [Adineta steineri]CAF4145688.1 unnamed protein product [Adineta steineri]